MKANDTITVKDVQAMQRQLEDNWPPNPDEEAARERAWKRYMDGLDRLERRKRMTETIGLTLAVITVVTTVYLLAGVW